MRGYSEQHPILGSALSLVCEKMSFNAIPVDDVDCRQLSRRQWAENEQVERFCHSVHSQKQTTLVGGWLTYASCIIAWWGNHDKIHDIGQSALFQVTSPFVLAVTADSVV